MKMGGNCSSAPSGLALASLVPRAHALGFILLPLRGLGEVAFKCGLGAAAFEGDLRAAAFRDKTLGGNYSSAPSGLALASLVPRAHALGFILLPLRGLGEVAFKCGLGAAAFERDLRAAAFGDKTLGGNYSSAPPGLALALLVPRAYALGFILLPLRGLGEVAFKCGLGAAALKCLASAAFKRDLGVVTLYSFVSF